MHIAHNQAAQRFETTIDGSTAYLSYDIIDTRTLDYNHTIVPSALGGRGVGSALVKFALDYAQQTEHKIVPSCSFVANYLSKHPEYQTLVTHE